jgi:hypothetical protein
MSLGAGGDPGRDRMHATVIAPVATGTSARRIVQAYRISRLPMA